MFLEPDFISLHFFQLLYVIGSALAVVLILQIVNRARRKAKVLESLHFVLYEVLLPQGDAKDKDGKNFKELISVMEQFYSGMAALRQGALKSWFSGKPYFSLELALSEVGEEASFYVAVPKDKRRLFEKQLEAFFPASRLELKTGDYNIFNKNGESVGSYAKFQESAILPIRTYKRLDADPLEIIANAFSKLSAEGEGAAMQVIVSPSAGAFKRKLKMALSELRKGKSLNQTKSKISQSLITKILLIIFDFFGNSSSKKSFNKDQSSFEEDIFKLVQDKYERDIMEVNIRLVASAKTKEEAKAILKELESAFLQFAESQGNAFEFKPAEGKDLAKLFYNFSFRFFERKHILYLNTAELASVFHFPVGQIASPVLKQLKAKDAPPPFNLSKEGVLLGINTYRGKETEVRLALDDRRRHLYIIGQTGTGKSGFMENMILQDIVSGKGVCMIDPHGASVKSVLGQIPKERVEDVIYFDPSDISRPIGLNMLEYDPNHPEQKTFVVNELFSIFQKLYGAVPESMGPMFEQYFRNATLLVMDDPESGNTLLEIERVMTEKEFRDYKLSRSRNPVVKNFWKEIAEKAGGESALQNIAPYITSKFDTFLANEIMRPIIAQEKSAFNFRKIMDEGKIILINLSKGKLGDINAYLIGLIIVGKILMAALSRVDLAEKNRRDFFLYIDEFQNITTDSISIILSEARKYRLNLIVAHQFIGQLDEKTKKAVFGNVGSIASFRVGAEDAEFLEKQFAPVFCVNDLMNIDNFNAYLKILINNQTAKPFNIKIPPPKEGNPVVAESIKELSAVKYGVPREEVEAIISKRFAA
jgi:hypothetical protein